MSTTPIPLRAERRANSNHQGWVSVRSIQVSILLRSFRDSYHQGASPISTFGMLVSMLLRSSGPETHAGQSFLLRKHFGFDRFDDVSVSIRTPPLVTEAQPDHAVPNS